MPRIERNFGNVDVWESQASEGRHLRAAVDLAPGTALIRQQPFAHTVLDNVIYSICAWTLRPASSLQRCSRCKLYRHDTTLLADVHNKMKHLTSTLASNSYAWG